MSLSRCGVFCYLTMFLLAAGAAAPMGYCADNPADPVLTLQAEPCFIGRESAGVNPISVSVTNRGSDTRADIDVHRNDLSSPARHYRMVVNLPGQGAISHFTLYPVTSTSDYANGFSVDVTAESPLHSAAQFLVGLPFGKLRSPEIAIITEHIGILSMIRATSHYDNTNELMACYVKPWNAPERAIGYAGISRLVLGDGMERLNPAQWTAIRDWVISGGSLILLGKEYLKLPQVDALSPVTPDFREARPVELAEPEWEGLCHQFGWKSSAHYDTRAVPAVQGSVGVHGLRPIIAPNQDVDPISRMNPSVVVPPSSEPELVLSSPPEAAFPPPGPIVRGALRPGANNVYGHTIAQDKGNALFARRQLGAGIVFYVGMDPTQSAFRKWPLFPKLWEEIVSRSAPLDSNGNLTSVAISLAPWVDGAASAAGQATGSLAEERIAQAAAQDPFQTKLPPLRAILYVFVGYFILAVPVTFVVLKRTRKMNLAWVTGPALAVLCGGAIYLFTYQLYAASLSRRTAGVITAVAGDPHARFSGETELFLPHAGSYDLTVRNADSTERSLICDSRDTSSLNRVKALDTFDDASAGTEAPSVNVANLSFQRLYHTQTVPWGGIESNLEVTSTTVSGERRDVIDATIVNRTGHALHNTYLAVPNSDALNEAVLFKIGEIAVGINHFKHLDARDYLLDASYEYCRTLPENWQTLTSPTLFATTSAKDFGPKIGEYVGGERSARVIVSLPPLKGKDGHLSEIGCYPVPKQVPK